jgi:hypothetical protein
MTDDDSKRPLFANTPPPLPADRASESVISTKDERLLLGAPPPPKQVGAISSTPLEISSLSPPGSDPPPPRSSLLGIEDAMNRPQRMPLSKLVAIGFGVFFVVVLLTVLLLFR